MTQFLVDVSRWQAGLNLEQVRDVGFSLVNIQLTGSGGYVAGPWAREYADRARELGMGVCCYHWLDGSATGAQQAELAWSRIRLLGGPEGVAHQVDCEDTARPASWEIWRDYVTAMQDKLGRHVVNYSGDWWWTPRGWNGAGLTPYHWAAPNAGYPGTYPGDNSPLWTARYGGWPELAVMQYAVTPVAGIKCSLSAIRDPAVWAALSGGAVTIAKPHHITARRMMLDHLDMHPGTSAYPDDLDPDEAGIVGNLVHAQLGTSYHLGRDQLDLAARPYSVYESARDQRGLDEHASAVDYGWFRATTAKGTFDLRAYSRWLVDLCRNGDPDTADLREVIYSPDGVVVIRWDRLGIRSTGDSSHLTHTHHSEFRDADGHRMVNLARRWLDHIGLLEDDVQLTDKLSNGSTVGGALVTIMNRTDYLANQLGLAQKLNDILAAAVNDDQNTVTMSAEDRQALAQQIALELAVPNVEDIGAVVDRELDEQSRAGADDD